MRLSKKEIEAHLNCADEALSWLIKAREQFKSYSSFHDYEQNMPEVIRFFRRLETTASSTAYNFFSILPEQYITSPEVGNDYWYNGELIRITKVDSVEYHHEKYFFYRKYAEDYIKPSERKEYSSPLRFAGLLLHGDTEPFEDLPKEELVPVVFPEANFEETIKLCDEIIEKIEQIKSTTFWLKQCATALHSKAYEDQSDKIDDNNNHVEHTHRLQTFADELATIADQIIPGIFITDDE